MAQPSSAAEFIWKVHGYTNEHIRFADTKAGAVITASGGILGVLLAAKVHHHFMDATFSVVPFDGKQTFLALASLGAFLLLGTALGCGFWAIKPRLWSKKGSGVHPKGVVYWENVTRHTTEEYVKAVLAMGDNDLVRIPSEHVHVLAGIASEKYFWVNLSVMLGAVGGMLAALVVLFSV